ncbi:MAG: STAS domain-containing protein [Planctomycetes bacterium]|nr:STAS domain-containing protein [Planctomycetota bacterium]
MPLWSPDFRIEQFEDVTIVRVTTDLIDSMNYEPLAAELRELVAGRDVTKLLVNLEHVEFLHSFALGHLAAIRKKLAERGGSLGFCGLRPSVRQVFGVTQFDRLVRVWNTEKAALAEWGSGAAATSSAPADDEAELSALTEPETTDDLESA